MELPMRTSFIERLPGERFPNVPKFFTESPVGVLGTAPKVDSRPWASTWCMIGLGL